LATYWLPRTGVGLKIVPSILTTFSGLHLSGSFLSGRVSNFRHQREPVVIFEPEVVEVVLLALKLAMLALNGSPL